MPPRKRTRSYDSAKIRAAVLAQYGHLRAAVAGLDAEQLAAPSCLAGWTVRDLAAHLAMAMQSVSRGLDRPAPAKAEYTALDFPFVTAAFAETIAEGSRQLAVAEADPVAFGDAVAARLAKDLAGAPDERVIDARFGSATLADYLVTRTVELTVHTDDFNRSTGLAVPIEREALAACTRLLADALAVKAPGGAVEVRIPPFAVVQCVEGPRHTRGTPPNVVETGPLTFVRLATGRTDWASALDAAEVSASGERADLSELLPIMG